MDGGSNSIAGIVGGGIGGQILAALLDSANMPATAAGATGGGVGGAILMIIVGLERPVF